MTMTRRAWLEGLLSALGLAAIAGPAGAQAGYPPPPPGIAPPGYSDPTRQHFEILRQQENDRRSFDAFQRSQQSETDRNLETLRRQQREQRRTLDAMRRGASLDQAVTTALVALKAAGDEDEPWAEDAQRLGLIEALATEGVHVAPRLGRMRISPHVYNDEQDVEKFVATFRRLAF